jgi:3-mercaptopyruvate sulfurtransferase SseA
VALQLRRHGIRHVRPLLGGYYEWKELGYPLKDVLAEEDSGQALGAIASDGAA